MAWFFSNGSAPRSADRVPARAGGAASLSLMAPRLGAGSLAVAYRTFALELVEECVVLLEDGRADLPRSFHECRKRLKVLRASLRGCRAGLGRRAFLEQDRRFRDAARELAEWRAEGALRGALSDLVRHYGLPMPGEGSVLELGAHGRGAPSSQNDPVNGGDSLEERSAAARRAARRRLLASRRDVEKWLSDPERGPAHEVLMDGLVRQWKKARRAYRRASREPRAEVVHRFRKQLKYHLHQLQTFQAQGCGFRGRVRELRALAEVLGAAHDLAELQERLRDAPGLSQGQPQGAGPHRSELHASELHGVGPHDSVLHWPALLAAREAELTLSALVRARPLFDEPPKALFRKVRTVLEGRE